MSTPRIASLCGVLAFTAAAVAQTPGFWLMGTAPGTTSSATYALSQNGSIGAGYSSYNGFPPSLPGFTWTSAGGRYDFGLETGMPLQTAALGLSSDGSMLAGYTSDITGLTRAFRRVGNGPLENLGAGSYQRSFGRAMSGDGSTVVGHLESTVSGVTVGQAFRWTSAGGIQPLGWLHSGSQISEANAISRDGGTIVGYSDAGVPEAFVWRQGTGMQALAPPAGWSSAFSVAYGVNADGSAVVGEAEAPDTSQHIIRWTPTGPQDLGNGIGFAVSDDGNVIGGATTVAALWTPSTGIVTLANYLAPYGVMMPAGWTPEYIYAVSGDGHTFAGEAVSNSGVIQGFVATVPAPSGVVVLLLPALLLQRRRRAMC